MTAMGVAISRDAVTARALAGATGAHRWELPAHAAPDVWAEALRVALRALRVAAPGVRTLHISLLPPLGDVRLAPLPVEPTERVRDAVEREAGKYFPVGDEPQVVAVEAVDARPGRAFATHLISAAPARELSAILAAATAAGFTVESLAPAQLAWAASASARSNGARVSVQGVTAGRVDVLELSHGAIVGLRKRRPEGPPAGEDEDGAVGEAAATAARFAAVGTARSLWPPSLRVARTQAIRRAARRWFVATAMLAFAALALLWFGDARRLASLRDARAALQPQVQAALARRDSVLRIEARVRALREFGDATSWTSALVAIGDALPSDAWLLQLRAAGDTLVLSGEAEQAEPAFTALANAPAFTGARLDAPIEQRIENGEVVSERFSVVAQRARRGARSGGKP